MVAVELPPEIVAGFVAEARSYLPAIGESLVALDDAGQSLGAIQSVVSDLASLINAISDSAQEHARASSMVAASMAEVSTVTEMTTEGTRNTADRVSYLARLAEQLRSSVAAFRLPTSDGPTTLSHAV